MHAVDTEAAAALIRAAFAAQPVAVDPLPSALKVSAADLRDHLQHGGGAVAEAGARLVGVILWSEQQGALHVARLSIATAWRRRGIASALLAWAEQAARQRGLPRLFLETRLVLEGNRRLFTSHGYREVSCSAHPGHTEPTSVLMEKWLAAR